MWLKRKSQIFAHKYLQDWYLSFSVLFWRWENIVSCCKLLTNQKDLNTITNTTRNKMPDVSTPQESFSKVVNKNYEVMNQNEGGKQSICKESVPRISTQKHADNLLFLLTQSRRRRVQLSKNEQDVLNRQTKELTRRRQNLLPQYSHVYAMHDLYC